MVNPMLVEGQIRGGVAQGIGTAMFEQIPYDEHGQPLAATLLDYHMPGAFEVPAIRIGHLHTAAVATEYGIKGMGEGGAVAPPAAIANAVRDALASIGAAQTGPALDGDRVAARRWPDTPRLEPWERLSWRRTASS
jgi:carbon-monoxide dehydrogenase large subunit